MWLTGSQTPASDDSMFGERTSIKAEFFLDSPLRETGDMGIEISAPNARPVGDEGVIDLTLRAKNPPLLAGSYVGWLESNNTVTRRTSNPCKPDTPADANSLAACDERTGIDMSKMRFRWFVESDKPGESFLTIKWPHQIGEAIAQQKKWTAILKRDDQVISSPVQRSSAGSSSSPGWGRPQTPNVLSSRRPSYKASDFEIDCAAQEITLPVQFQTTLGVSGATYGYLSILGGFLSAFLGGGWIWQVIALFRKNHAEDGSKKNAPVDSPFLRERLRAYREVSVSLQGLREAARALWEEATEENLARFKKNLDETRQKVANEGILFHDADWRDLEVVLEKFADYFAGKESLIRHRYSPDRTAPEAVASSSYRYEFAPDQIEKNRKTMDEYEVLLEKLRRTYHGRLSGDSN